MKQSGVGIGFGIVVVAVGVPGVKLVLLILYMTSVVLRMRRFGTFRSRVSGVGRGSEGVGGISTTAQGHIGTAYQTSRRVYTVL